MGYQHQGIPHTFYGISRVPPLYYHKSRFRYPTSSWLSRLQRSNLFTLIKSGLNQRNLKINSIVELNDVRDKARYRERSKNLFNSNYSLNVYGI